MGARRKGRIIAFQTLYRYECTNERLDDLLDFSWRDQMPGSKPAEEAIDFARLLITGTINNLDVIDRIIRNQLENWDFTRLARVDLAILRIAVYCLLYQQDIPITVTIDEAIDISKDFGSDESYRFINGVLDGVRKAQEVNP